MPGVPSFKRSSPPRMPPARKRCGRHCCRPSTTETSGPTPTRGVTSSTRSRWRARCPGVRSRQMATWRDWAAASPIHGCATRCTPSRSGATRIGPRRCGRCWPGRCRSRGAWKRLCYLPFRRTRAAMVHLRGCHWKPRCGSTRGTAWPECSIRHCNRGCGRNRSGSSRRPGTGWPSAWACAYPADRGRAGVRVRPSRPGRRGPCGAEARPARGRESRSSRRRRC